MWKWGGLPIRKHEYQRRLRILTLATWACLLIAANAAGQATPSGEYAVKAAFLFHFAEFVEWPVEAFHDASTPITYCTTGEDPFRGALDDSLRAKVVGNRGVRVKHLKEGDSTKDCQILFIGAAESKRTTSILANVKGSAVLTVGESPNFAESGGMIEFCREANKIRFDINLAAVGAAKLKMSARLLTLAKTVIGTSGGG
jgi:YfiR/HmsC-like